MLMYCFIKLSPRMTSPATSNSGNDVPSTLYLPNHNQVFLEFNEIGAIDTASEFGYVPLNGEPA